MQRRFKPDGYSPRQVVQMSKSLGFENYVSSFRDSGIIVHRYSTNLLSYCEGLSEDDVIYESTKDRKGMVFNHFRLSPYKASEGLEAKIDKSEIINGRKITHRDFEVTKNGELKLQKAHKIEIEQIKKGYVDLGFVDNVDKVQLFMHNYRNIGGYTGEVVCAVGIKAKDISFKKPIKTNEQYERYRDTRYILGRELNKFISRDSGTMEFIRPNSPTSSSFTKLLLDGESFEKLANFKYSKKYIIHVDSKTGEYPPNSFESFMFKNATNIIAFKDFESGGMSAYYDTSKREKNIKAALEIAGIKTDTKIFELLLDNRHLRLLIEDVKFNKIEESAREANELNPNRLKDLLKRISRENNGRER